MDEKEREKLKKLSAENEARLKQDSNGRKYEEICEQLKELSSDNYIVIAGFEMDGRPISAYGGGRLNRVLLQQLIVSIIQSGIPELMLIEMIATATGFIEYQKVNKTDIN